MEQEGGGYLAKGRLGCAVGWVDWIGRVGWAWWILYMKCTQVHNIYIAEKHMLRFYLELYF
jgi:hypothetical protein